MIADYYSIELLSIPTNESYAFGQEFKMIIDSSEVRLFFSKDSKDINGGNYEVDSYYYYDFFDGGLEVAEHIERFGIEMTPRIIFFFYEEYIFYGWKK